VNKQLRRVGIGMLACYVALFAMVNYVQVVRADNLNNDPRNTRAIVRDFDRPRGQIISADGAVLARTVPAAAGDRFEFQREYPEGDLFGGITGYFNFNFGATGVEKTYNDELAGQTTEQELHSLSDLFVDREHTGDVTLTIRKDIQQIARDALGEQKGSVVAIDPRTGELLAFWGYPSYDPNILSVHDPAQAQAAKDLLEASPDQPLRMRPYQERFFPGSTFKIVTGSIGVDSGQVTETQPVYPQLSSLDLPQTTRNLSNFGGETCGGTLFHILAVSCNTAFAQMGLDLGPDLMNAGANAFGFNDAPPIDLPGAVSSAFPTQTDDDLPQLAQSAIGQNSVQSTPLQMALAASAIANNGVMMTPHVMHDVRNEQGEVITSYDPRAWRQPISAQTADTMHRAMLGVVQDGTATRLQIPGFEVGGKTGTAQTNPTDPNSGVNAWIVGFAGPPGGQATVAVAVLVEAQTGFSEATGGRVAAPIANCVMRAVLAVQGGGTPSPCG
jgi:peptidoglycan glycosyltransferase